MVVIDRLELSRIDMALRDGRYLQYFSDEIGLTEVDLYPIVGVRDGNLVFGRSGLETGVDAGSVGLTNGHTLHAKIAGVTRYLDLNRNIRTEDEVLTYRADGYPGAADEFCICCRFAR
ncbi:hypothetical protein Dda_4841 [Drechslerella dactyloides]|uniref:Uncharacterized protein n=1 Tax=Drechslerella dactyloides TaxID=74499 RepID=A0AAD6IXN1_DREDA|nr:hypothetical protein Dda_4841 [Drechslerella dactyloides]